MRRLGSVQSHRMPAKFTHQKLDLNATNFTQFHFRGMVVVKNLLEQARCPVSSFSSRSDAPNI